MGDAVLAVVSASSAPARWAMARYFDELARRLPGGFDPGAAVEQAAAVHDPPHGVFVVALHGGEVLGCGALQHLDQNTSEVKRMWVRPASRGQGLGRRLLLRLEREAQRAGRSTVVLDTHGSLTEALELYRGLGYTPVAPYNDNPYAQLWFAKELATPARDPQAGAGP